MHAQDAMEELPYPTVKEYMIWVRNRMTVTFRRLDQPKVPPHRTSPLERSADLRTARGDTSGVVWVHAVIASLEMP